MAGKVFVSVEERDFNVSEELDKIKCLSSESGAVVLFIGKVRQNKQGNLDFLKIESFSEMARKEITKICNQSLKQWKLDCIVVKHRYGKLKPDDNIVLLITSSDHRNNAYEASMYIMRLLKSNVPFWKKEISGKEEIWLENN
jgi:molybdopterin synthase catalytic subunit